MMYFIGLLIGALIAIVIFMAFRLKELRARLREAYIFLSSIEFESREDDCARKIVAEDLYITLYGRKPNDHTY